MSTEAKLFQECENEQDVFSFVKTLDAGVVISVIKSRGKFYVEEEDIFLRTYESLLYQGAAGKIKL